MAKRRENQLKSSLAFQYEPDSETGRFIKSMEEVGATQVFNDIFTKLYEESIKPDNPLQWIKEFLRNKATESLDEVQAEIKQLRSDIMTIAKEHEMLKHNVCEGEINLADSDEEKLGEKNQEFHENEEEGEAEFEEEEEQDELNNEDADQYFKSLMRDEIYDFMDHSTETSPQPSRQFLLSDEYGPEETEFETDDESVKTTSQKSTDSRKSRKSKTQKPKPPTKNKTKRKTVGKEEEEEVESDEDDEEEEEAQLPKISYSQHLASMIDYQNCIDCIPINYWTKDFSLGTIDLNGDNEEDDDDVDALYFDKVKGKHLINLPKLHRKNEYVVENQQKSKRQVEEFSWLPSIIRRPMVKKGHDHDKRKSQEKNKDATLDEPNDGSNNSLKST